MATITGRVELADFEGFCGVIDGHVYGPFRTSSEARRSITEHAQARGYVNLCPINGPRVFTYKLPDATRPEVR